MDTALSLLAAVNESPADAAAVDRLDSLMEAHGERLFRLGLRLSGNRDDALDLVQDTLVRAAGRLHAIPDDDPAAGAWLVRVLVNLVRDRWRRRAVRREATFGRAAPAAAADAPELRLAVGQALQSLAPKRRAIVVLADIEGRTSREIATTLKINDATVRWHLAAGRRALRQILEPRRGQPR